MSTDPTELLTRRQLLRAAGLGTLALGVGCTSTVTKVVHVREPWVAPPLPIVPPTDLPRPRPGLVDGWVPGREPVLTARAHETPQLRPGEFVAGLYSADTFPGQVALSFDDMPKPDFTEEVLRQLGEAGVPATFFVVGRLVRRYPDLLKQIVDAGHELGNHTYTHPSFTTLSHKQIRDELDRTQEMVDRVLGRHHPMRLVRPPYGLPYYGPARGRAIERASRAIAEHKACVVLWTLGTGDTVPGCTIERVFTSLKRRFAVGTGGTMVFHPTRCAKRSLRPVIRLVRHKKLRVRTVRQFIEEKYGWPLESLAEWGPKLVDRPTTAGI